MKVEIKVALIGAGATLAAAAIALGPSIADYLSRPGPSYTFVAGGTDDLLQCTLNGRDFLEAGFNQSRTVGVDDYVVSGKNEIRCIAEDFNDGAMFSYKFRLEKDGVPIWSEEDHCDGDISCRHSDPIVFDGVFEFIH